MIRFLEFVILFVLGLALLTNCAKPKQTTYDRLVQAHFNLVTKIKKCDTAADYSNNPELEHRACLKRAERNYQTEQRKAYTR